MTLTYHVRIPYPPGFSFSVHVVLPEHEVGVIFFLVRVLITPKNAMAESSPQNPTVPCPDDLRRT